jgi:hypothetical protein
MNLQIVVRNITLNKHRWNQLTFSFTHWYLTLKVHEMLAYPPAVTAQPPAPATV